MVYVYVYIYIASQTKVSDHLMPPRQHRGRLTANTGETCPSELRVTKVDMKTQSTVVVWQLLDPASRPSKVTSTTQGYYTGLSCEKFAHIVKQHGPPLWQRLGLDCVEA